MSKQDSVTSVAFMETSPRGEAMRAAMSRSDGVREGKIKSEIRERKRCQRELNGGGRATSHRLKTEGGGEERDGQERKN